MRKSMLIAATLALASSAFPSDNRIRQAPAPSPAPAPAPKRGKPSKAEKKAAKRARTRGVPRLDPVPTAESFDGITGRPFGVATDGALSPHAAALTVDTVLERLDFMAGHEASAIVRDTAEAAAAMIRAARGVPLAPTLLGEVWMAFGAVDDGRLVALPEYAAVSEREVGSKIMDTARREGYRGLLADRLRMLGWTIRRVTLATGVATDGGKHD